MAVTARWHPELPSGARVAGTAAVKIRAEDRTVPQLIAQARGRVRCMFKRGR